MQEINIGKKVQELRNMRQMSLRQLAEKAHLTSSMLSQIENKGVNPSINTLKEIARALDVPLFKFFQDDIAPDRLIVRKDQNKIIGSPSDDVMYKLLTPDVSGMIEFCLMEIPPHSASSSLPHEHKGEEVAYVIAGSIQIDIDGQQEEMQEGDSIRIPPLSPHRWLNHAEKGASVIFAITPPSF